MAGILSMKTNNLMKVTKQYLHCKPISSRKATLLCFLFILMSCAHQRNITPLGADELDAFTIQSQFEKQKKQYPFIKPVISRPNDTGVNSYYDILYKRSPSSELYLDIFTPENEPQLRPAVVFVHGGAWRTGHRSHHNETASYLAKQNFVGITIDYRLSREALYPAALEDINDAIEWLREHHIIYGIDPNKIVISGASSGAHLASVIATRQDQYAKVQGLINIDGVPDLSSEKVRQFEDRPNKKSYAALWLGGRFEQVPALWKAVSPILHVDKHTPPSLFINSSHDRFHVGRDVFLAKLHEFGTPSYVHMIEDTPHPFWLFHPWIDEMHQHILDFLIARFDGSQDSQSQFLSLNDALEKTDSDMQDLSKWHHYIQRSESLREQDNSLIKQELFELKLTRPKPAKAIKKVDRINYWEFIKRQKAIPLDQINNMISWQAPNGGWSKNTDFYSNKRQKAQYFGQEPSYVSTIDNKATIIQVLQLKEALKAYQHEYIAESLHRAIHFLLNAQYPNGGFPQVYPLVGGYHDLVTYNDDALSLILKIFDDLVHSPDAYKLSPELIQKVTKAFHLLIARLEQDQHSAGADKAAWGQQHHPLNFSLQPARAYEMASLASMETANMLAVLIDLKTSSPSIEMMITKGCKWIDKTKMSAKKWQRYPDRASEIINGDSDDIIWPRFISVTSSKALFGDRDGKIYDSVDKVSLERQLGYAWYHASPKAALEKCKQKEF